MADVAAVPLIKYTRIVISSILEHLYGLVYTGRRFINIINNNIYILYAIHLKYIREINYVSRVHSVAAALYLLLCYM